MSTSLFLSVFLAHIHAHATILQTRTDTTVLHSEPTGPCASCAPQHSSFHKMPSQPHYVRPYLPTYIRYANTYTCTYTYTYTYTYVYLPNTRSRALANHEHPTPLTMSHGASGHGSRQPSATQLLRRFLHDPRSTIHDPRCLLRHRFIRFYDTVLSPDAWNAVASQWCAHER